MATEEAAVPKIVVDKYRSFLYDEADNTEWRYGGPPTYDVVNKLFEEGRTKVRMDDDHLEKWIYILNFYPSASLVINKLNLFYRNGQKGPWKRQCRMLLRHGRWRSHIKLA